ncbi:hypothetical protein Plav_2688 [Parvibaculum lavamentivorans DS-1]|uniref:Lytic transglycosylase catalytic n=1 Tax=Parvibaculum lavamentivorans (strain DS-1 / DSM 13023 / NCIMB 13966) TaxID=402881 RepID=A7HWL3_PARL1|nr:hypothetical protein [Parvibaculum lavamentivorans]ABS64296.1 hypothetical protein Plav_2688 [Parvibaculum lavamentivorans DS-1]
MSLVETIGIQPTIATALQAASQRTGTDFDYLLKTAMRESSLNCEAQSKTSSACGLFQFTEQSWLGTLKKHGEALGLGDYSASITRNANGRYVVENAAERQEILALRNDAHASALMAGAYTQDSAAHLEGRLGREVNEGELYIAHFLGAGGASKLIGAAEDTPNARADTLFPAAADANRSIFYNADGRARTVSEVYRNLVAKHENADASRMQEMAENRPLSSNRNQTVTKEKPGFTEQPAGEARRSYATRGAAALSPVSGGAYPAASTGTSVGRAPLQLTPGIVELLASLDPIPEGSETLRSGDKKNARDEAEARDERRERARMLPRSGFAYS